MSTRVRNAEDNASNPSLTVIRKSRRRRWLRVGLSVRVVLAYKVLTETGVKLGLFLSGRNGFKCYQILQADIFVFPVDIWVETVANKASQ